VTRGDGNRRPFRSARRTAALIFTPILVAAPVVASAKTAANGLAYSSASARVVQRQPAAGSCHALGTGLYSRPDPRCTPGTLNPSVTQRTISATICRAGWTATVRPSESVTRPEKLASMSAYGDGRLTSAYEYDHLVPLALGGAVNDSRNLWPEPDYPSRSGFYLNPKDRLERVLSLRVCTGAMSLSQAQRLIAGDWVSAYHRYG
jgi:hypothetical protein